MHFLLFSAAANNKRCRNNVLIALTAIGLVLSLIIFVMVIAGTQKTLEANRDQALIASNTTENKLFDGSEQLFLYDLLKKAIISSVGIIVFGILLVGIAIKNTGLVTKSYYLSFILGGAMVYQFNL